MYLCNRQLSDSTDSCRGGSPGSLPLFFASLHRCLDGRAKEYRRIHPVLHNRARHPDGKKTKSRLGCDFLKGSYQDGLERVVNPFRIPRDDSSAKVTLFPDSANKSYDRFPVKPGMTVEGQVGNDGAEGKVCKSLLSLYDTKPH